MKNTKNSESKLSYDARLYRACELGFDTGTVWYHGTNAVFDEFKETNDIGFHFGTRGAATDILRRHGTKREITVSKIEPSMFEGVHRKANRFKNSEDKREYAFYLIASRVSHPRSELEKNLQNIAMDELEGIISEFEAKPLSQAFTESIKKENAGVTYQIEIDDMPYGEPFTNKEEAKIAASKISKDKVGGYFLKAKNSLRTDDLGQWSVISIAMAADLSEHEMALVFHPDNRTVEDDYESLRCLLESKGFDSIIYENQVEDEGSESIIVFRSSQIKRIDDPFDLNLDNDDEISSGMAL